MKKIMTVLMPIIGNPLVGFVIFGASIFMLAKSAQYLRESQIIKSDAIQMVQESKDYLVKARALDSISKKRIFEEKDYMLIDSLMMKYAGSSAGSITIP